MEASYLDSGPANDSRDGGSEESEEVEEKASEGGQDSSFSGAPLPKYLGQVSGKPLWYCLWAGDPFADIKF